MAHTFQKQGLRSLVSILSTHPRHTSQLPSTNNLPRTNRNTPPNRLLFCATCLSLSCDFAAIALARSATLPIADAAFPAICVKGPFLYGVIIGLKEHHARTQRCWAQHLRHMHHARIGDINSPFRRERSRQQASTPRILKILFCPCFFYHLALLLTLLPASAVGDRVGILRVAPPSLKGPTRLISFFRRVLLERPSARSASGGPGGLSGLSTLRCTTLGSFSLDSTPRPSATATSDANLLR